MVPSYRGRAAAATEAVAWAKATPPTSAAAAANLAPSALLIGDPLTVLLGALARWGFRTGGGVVAAVAVIARGPDLLGLGLILAGGVLAGGGLGLHLAPAAGHLDGRGAQ